MSRAGAGFIEGERTGKNNNIIRPAGSNKRNSGGSEVEELSSHSDIEEADLNPDDIVIEELSDGRSRIRERKEGEKPVRIDLDSLSNGGRLSKWFSEEEIEEMHEKEELATGKRKERDIDEVWEGIRSACEEHNDRVREVKKEEEIAAAKAEMERHSKYSADVNDLSGREFQELISEAQGEGSTDPDGFEVVKKKIEEKWSKSEPDTSINSPELEEEDLEAGIRAFEERGGVFEELAQDLRQSDSETVFETRGPNIRKITTQNEDMKQALRSPENEPIEENISIEIKSDTGDRVVATVTKED